MNQQFNEQSYKEEHLSEDVNLNNDVNIDDHKRENGYYDIPAIANAILAGNETYRPSTHFDICNTHPLTLKARRRNAEMAEAESAAIKAEDVADAIVNGPAVDDTRKEHDARIKSQINQMSDSEYVKLVDLVDEINARLHKQAEGLNLLDDDNDDLRRKINRVVYALLGFGLKAGYTDDFDGHFVPVITGNTLRYEGYPEHPFWTDENEEYLASLGL